MTPELVKGQSLKFAHILVQTRRVHGLIYEVIFKVKILAKINFYI